jgi:putative Mg2+ transporter-C (MgtC) family protein
VPLVVQVIFIHFVTHSHLAGAYGKIFLMEMFLAYITDLPLYEYIVPVLLAALAGGLIGIEREYRDKTAGFRTMILIAVGSCLFTVFSEIMGGPKGEITRIAASIVTGVGFLGAGVIFKNGASISGLTTAASIWLVASLGMGAAIGQYGLVMAVTIFVLMVLLLLPPIERWLDRLHDFSKFRITIKNSDKVEQAILDIFYEYDIEIAELRHTRTNKEERILDIKANMTIAEHEEISMVLVNEKLILAFED